jgi:MFS transporter, SP family, sugar:H+ symporter
MPGGPSATGEGIGANAPKTFKSKVTGIMITCFAAFGGMLYGYDTGTIAGLQVTRDWLQTFGRPDESSALGYSITTSEQSLVVSILSVGTFFGALLGAVSSSLSI